jgi:hypothetical protein
MAMSGSISHSNLKFVKPQPCIRCSTPRPGLRIHFQAVPVTMKLSAIG